MTKTNKEGTFGLIIAVLLLISIVIALILMIIGTGGISGFFLRFGLAAMIELALTVVWILVPILIIAIVSYGAFRMTGYPLIGVLFFIVLLFLYFYFFTLDIGAII